MKLSIIIPVYKVEAYLRKCVESVLGEAGVNMEVILVDDCSPDGSGAICRQFAESDSRVRYLRRNENGGLSAARNTGLDAATGDYVTFVDSDDYIAPGTFAGNMAVIAANPAVDILEYPVYVYYGGRRAEMYVPESSSACGVAAFDSWVLRKGYYRCYSCNKIFRRGLWDGVRFPVKRYYEDIFTIPGIVGKASVMECSDKGLYYYCDREGSISNSGNEKVLSDFVSAELALWELLKKSPCFTRLYSDEFYLTVCNWQAGLLCRGGEMLLPDYRVELRPVLSGHFPLSLKMKALLSKLLGRNYCRVLASYLKMRI